MLTEAGFSRNAAAMFVKGRCYLVCFRILQELLSGSENHKVAVISECAHLRTLDCVCGRSTGGGSTGFYCRWEQQTSSW